MLIEEKSYLKQLILIGMLIGLMAGSACGFLESIFVIFTGFNVPFIYIEGNHGVYKGFPYSLPERDKLYFICNSTISPSLRT